VVDVAQPVDRIVEQYVASIPDPSRTKSRTVPTKES
jgi:hypothetical protein